LKISEQSYKDKNKRTNVDNYGYLLDSSTERTAVYMSPDGIIIGNRGTDPRDISDLKQDALLAIGQIGSTDRLKRAIKTVEEVKAKYPGLPISFTGHSLGGAIAAELSERFGGRAVTFNMGSSPIKQLNKKYRNVTHYTTGFDPISSSSQHKTFIKPEGINVHSLSNFRV
jgi:hypothetical protein